MQMIFLCLLFTGGGNHRMICWSPVEVNIQMDLQAEKDRLLLELEEARATIRRLEKEKSDWQRKCRQRDRMLLQLSISTGNLSNPSSNLARLNLGGSNYVITTQTLSKEKSIFSTLV